MSRITWHSCLQRRHLRQTSQLLSQNNRSVMLVSLATGSGQIQVQSNDAILQLGYFNSDRRSAGRRCWNDRKSALVVEIPADGFTFKIQNCSASLIVSCTSCIEQPFRLQASVLGDITLSHTCTI